jgi:FkbM family methyltransferase
MFDFLEAVPDDERLLTEARREGVTLFGAGNFARAVHEALSAIDVEVRAFLVSEQTAATLDGIPVIALDELNDEARSLPLWVAVYNRSAAADLIAIAAQCWAQGIVRVRLPQEYFQIVQNLMGWRFWLCDRRSYAGVRARIESVFGMLDDDESRRQFLETLRFRIGIGLDQSPLPTIAPQYFLPEIQQALATSERGCTLVDGGAYDGDTIVKAVGAFPLVRAYAFEPDLANFTRLSENLATAGIPVIGYPCGLSDTTEWLEFAGGQGESCTISRDGNTRIQCVRLDECLIGEPVDFIKLDVEGHELAALAGASGIIARDQPVLAIAAYHRWDDLWRIPEVIRALVPTYRIAYRIHEYNTFEGILYAI